MKKFEKFMSMVHNIYWGVVLICLAWYIISSFMYSCNCPSKTRMEVFLHTPQHFSGNFKCK